MSQKSAFRLMLAMLMGIAFVFLASCGGGSTDPGGAGNEDPPDIDPGTVMLDPEPDDINAPWTLTYPGRFIYTGNGDSTMTDLPAGPYRITWGHVPGWTTPPEVVETMPEDEGVLISATYTELSSIHIDVVPDGIEASWQLEGPDRFVLWGRQDTTVTDVVEGEYIVTWGDAVDYINPYAETKTLAQGSSITFTGVYSEISVPAGFAQLNAGTFTMGSPQDEPGHILHEWEHQVTLTRNFQIQVTEVTNRQYMEMVQWAYDNGHVTATSASVIDNLGSDHELLDLDTSACDIDFADGVFTCRWPVHPVRAVTWYGAAAYCNWLSMQQSLAPAYDHTTWACNQHSPYTAQGWRLPTEAEWEFACRGGSTTAFSNGPITVTGCDGDPVLDLIGWYCGNSGPDPNTVGQLSPNAWGIYDMHGNLWEWCNDQYGENYYLNGDDANLDPVGPTDEILPTTHFVLRSGGIQNGASACRSACRANSWPDTSFYSWGFRVARSVQ